MLTLHRRAAVIEVQLTRPEVRNAFAPPMIDALTAWARSAASDSAARVAVLSGAGPVFCAGADIGWMREMRAYDERRNQEDAARLADMFEALSAVPFPLIARVHGAALGGGSGLLAACDHVVAADDAIFGFTEVRLGLLPAVIAPYVARRLGWSAARSLFLTGRRISATEARRAGLVHDVVPAGDLDAAVARAVDDVMRGAPSAQRATKALFTQLEEGAASPRDLTIAAIAAQRVSPEGQEGLAAFLERRDPLWYGDTDT